MGACISLGRIFKSGGDTPLADYSRVARAMSALQVVCFVLQDSFQRLSILIDL